MGKLQRRGALSLLSAAALLATLFVAPAALLAQMGEGEWSIPLKLFEGDGYVNEPVVVADPTGRVHVLWSLLDSSGPDVLYYARWNEAGWTAPVDVIAAEKLTHPSATVDRTGRLHVVWHGVGDQLYHSRAPVREAASAHAWDEPMALGRAGNRAHIVADRQGRLHLGYSGRGEGGETRYARSTDGGATWSHDVSVALPSEFTHMADDVRLAVVPGSAIHIVWTEWDLAEDGNPSGVFYARSRDDGKTWTSPMQMAGAGYDEINVVAVNEDEIHLAWNGAAWVSGRYHCWSSDGGETWSDVGMITPPSMGGGSTGPPGLVVDSSGKVHTVVHTSHEEGSEHFTMYAQWNRQAWSPPVNVSRTAPGYVGVDNEEADVAIAAGNQLHVVFRDAEGRRLWHTSSRLSAPPLPAEALVSEAATGTATPTAAPTADPTPSSRVDFAEGPEYTPGLMGTPGGVLVVSVLPVASGVLGLLVLKLARWDRR